MSSTDRTSTAASISRTIASASLWATAALVLATSAVQAAGLRLDAAPVAPGQPAAAPGEFAFLVGNEGAFAVAAVRLFASSGIDIRCDAATAGGRGFVDGGQLSAGDQVSCRARQPAGSPNLRGYSLLVAARDAAGLPLSSQLSVVRPSGAPVSPDQGVVVLLAGAVHNDGNGNGLLESGETIAYHYTVVNAGTLALSALAAVDLGGPVSCPLTALAIGQSMVCIRTYAITPVDQAAGLVLNDVEVVGVDSNALPVQGGDLVLTQNLAGSAGIRVVKSPLLLNDADGSGFASVGDLIGYTFLVKNSNAQTLSAVTLIEPDPTRIDTPIVCAASTLGGQPYTGNGTGTLPENDTATCSAQYTVRASDAAIGQVLNLVVAQGTAPIAGTVQATGASAVVMPVGGQISVAKTASTAMVSAGGNLVYTVVVTNTGTLPVANVVVSDPLPVGISAFSWTCAGAACPVAAGTGAISQSIASLPAGASVIYTVNATVAATPPGTVLNVVSVTPANAVQCAPANTPPPCQAQVPVGIIAPSPRIVPTGSALGMLVMAVLLMVSGLVAVRASAAGGRMPSP
jgi:uncharacterized repeat protein (TIGR01451 family)